MTFKATVGVAILCFTAACTSTAQVASHYAKTELVSASQGGTVTVSSTDDATLANTSIVIPPNALASDTTITIAEGAAVSVPTGGQSAGPVADFGPSTAKLNAPVTITLPYTLPSAVSVNTLEVVAVQDDGTLSTIPNLSLTLNTGNTTVSFTVNALARFGCVVPASQTCPAGEFFCGCPGYGGTCVSDASQISCELNCPIEVNDGGVCPAGETICCGTCTPGVGCPNLICTDVDAGTGCPAGEIYCACLQACEPADSACPACEPLDGGTSVCSPGETPCCPGDSSTCVPSGTICNLACVADAGTSVCPPGDYFCGCPGYGGTCIPDKQACDLNCPIEVDAGTPVCPPSQDLCCGVCQAGGLACPEYCSGGADAGTTTGCAAGTTYCACENACIPSNEACPECELIDGGSDGVDAGTCPAGDFFCGCPGYGGTCEPLGTVCALNCPAEGVDAGN